MKSFRLRNYLSDRIVTLSLLLAGLVIIWILLLFIHAGAVAQVAICMVYLVFTGTSIVWEYIRRKRYYDQLLERLEQIDRKNLAAEVMEKPDFLEGTILQDVLRMMGQSMTEQVSLSRQNMMDFKEYVEMWIHEVKLPIAALELMAYNDRKHAQGNENASKSDQGHKILSQIKRLDSCADQILYYIRSEVAEKDFVIKKVALGKVFAKVVQSMRVELLEADFSIETRDLDVEVYTDDKWLEFILRQVVSNSIKYIAKDREPKLEAFSVQASKEAGEIQETAGEPNMQQNENQPGNREIALHIRDNGIGIPPGDIPRIFEKSFTGENGRKGEASTGMGLYIAKKLCEKLNHSISVRSAQGSYTEIILTFPSNKYYTDAL